MAPRLYVCKRLPHSTGQYEVRTQDEKVKLYGPLGMVEGNKLLSIWGTREDAERDMKRRVGNNT